MYQLLFSFFAVLFRTYKALKSLVVMGAVPCHLVMGGSIPKVLILPIQKGSTSASLFFTSVNDASIAILADLAIKTANFYQKKISLWMLQESKNDSCLDFVCQLLSGVMRVISYQQLINIWQHCCHVAHKIHQHFQSPVSSKQNSKKKLVHFKNLSFPGLYSL